MIRWAYVRLRYALVNLRLGLVIARGRQRDGGWVGSGAELRSLIVMADHRRAWRKELRSE